jgi:hypothetical protein
MRRAFYAVLAAATVAFGPSLAREAWAACTAILATDATKVNKGGDTMTGALILNGASSWVITGSSLTTSGGLFGNGSGITSINASNIASGTLGNARLDSSSVTLQGNAFNGASQLVQNNSSGELPALSGVNLTALNADNVASGTLAVGRGGTGITSAGGTANRVVRTSDGSAFSVGQIIGPDVAASTIATQSLNQSGANTNDILKWNGSQWVAGAPAAGLSESDNPTWTGAHTWANGSSISIANEDIITSSHPCRVINSTRTIGMPTSSGSNSTYGTAVSGSTLTLSGFNSASYLSVRGNWSMDNDSSGNLACTVLLNGVIQQAHAASLDTWRNSAGSSLESSLFGNEFVYPAAPGAGSHSISLVCRAPDGGDTWRLFGPAASTPNWIEYREVSCTP